jgi:predicted ATP-grasp superfamily ATP-dependent carboligase
MRKNSVIIFDASPRHTIEIVRSLTKKGISTIAFSSENFTPVKFSKYIYKFHKYSIPRNKKESMYLIRQLNNIKCDVIIPSGLWGFYFLSRYKRYFNANIPVTEFTTFIKAYDKRITIKECKKINIPIPKTMFISSSKDLNKIEKKFEFPVVIKAAEEWGSVKYVNDIDEAYKFFKIIGKQFPSQIKAGKLPFVQEYIRGDGYGFYALCDHGKIKASFMHKRLREFPATGGPSSLAESFYDVKLKSLGEKILSHLNWHGVAMVEFKKDEIDGEYKIMEINPKFWGSLALSIRCGIDFPYLLYKLALGKNLIDSYSNYKENLQFQWFTLDLAHCISTKKLCLYLKTLTDKKVHNDIYLDDPLQVIALFFNSIKIFLSKAKKLPHGKPKWSNN